MTYTKNLPFDSLQMVVRSFSSCYPCHKKGCEQTKRDFKRFFIVCCDGGVSVSY